MCSSQKDRILFYGTEGVLDRDREIPTAAFRFLYSELANPEF